MALGQVVTPLVNSPFSIKTELRISFPKHGTLNLPIYALPLTFRTRDEYIAPIPENERGDMMKAYSVRLNSDDEQTRLTAARAWSKWE